MDVSIDEAWEEAAAFEVVQSRVCRRMPARRPLNDRSDPIADDTDGGPLERLTAGAVEEDVGD
jgi:hypothetical protein